MEAIRASVSRSLGRQASTPVRAEPNSNFSPLLEFANDAQEVVLLHLQRVPKRVLARKFAM